MSVSVGPADVGCVVLGLFYAINGALHFLHWRELAGALAARGVPFPSATLATGSIFQAIAGSLLAVQAHLRFATAGLAVFTLLASLLFLDFWRQDGAARQAGIRAWQTNVALMGALVAIGFR